MTQQIYTTPTPFSGTNISIPNSGKGYTSNMVIKGQTYQNLYVENKTLENYKFEKTSLSLVHNFAGSGISNINMFKIGQTYTFIFTVDVQNLTTTDDAMFYTELDIRVANHDTQYMRNQIALNANGVIIKKMKYTIQNGIISINPQIAGKNISGIISTNLIILEGDWTNKEVPSQITGIESVGEKENNKISILSRNKNLFKYENLIQGTYADNDGSYALLKNRVCTKTHIKINSNKLYYETNSKFVIGDVYTYNENKKYMKVLAINKSEGYITLDSNVKYIMFNIKAQNLADNFTVDDVPDGIMICESDKKPNFEPHKEDKKEILLPIENGLKSLPDGIYDTIEQREDGVYLVQRVGEILYNSANNSVWYNFNITNTIVSAIHFVQSNYKTMGNNIICDSIPVISGGQEADFSIKYGDTANGVMTLSLPTYKLTTNTADGFRDYISKNPIKVYYELVTPIETKLDINNLNLETFKDLTYVTSENNISPILEFKAPILGYKTINPIQLKTTQDGTEVNVYPYSTPELITFGDNETLADKMNNIENTHKHNNATVTTDGFMSKESYSKLESLTEYTHPSTHAATMITQDSSHRFVTDTEKNNWNAKASTNVATSSTNGLMSNTDKQKIDRISNNFDIVYDANTETIRFKFR